MAPRIILCVNSGSSSLKFALYQIGDGEEMLLAQGAVECNGAQSARLWIHSDTRQTRDPRSGYVFAFSSSARSF